MRLLGLRRRVTPTGAMLLIALAALLAIGINAVGAGGTQVCIPSKEGKQVVTPKGGVCKPGYTLKELGAEGKEGPAGKEGKEGPQGKEGKPGSAAIATFRGWPKVESPSFVPCLGFETHTYATRCPAQGAIESDVLAPVPAGGATVTNLYATTTEPLSGTDSATVDVVDNTKQVVLLGCTIDTGLSSCQNTTGSGVAAGGDALQVGLILNGRSAEQKGWRVSFRY